MCEDVTLPSNHLYYFPDSKKLYSFLSSHLQLQLFPLQFVAKLSLRRANKVSFAPDKLKHYLDWKNMQKRIGFFSPNSEAFARDVIALSFTRTICDFKTSN